MARNEDMFQKWFSDILGDLTKNPDAGAVLLMVAFPLLESYLRKKLQIRDKKGSLPPSFYAELAELFPQLKAQNRACKFWGIFRHGLLHLARLNREGHGWRMDEQAQAVEIVNDNYFKVNPAKFAQCVLQEITSHLEVFLRGERLGVFAGGTGTVQPPPVIKNEDRYGIDKTWR